MGQNRDLDRTRADIDSAGQGCQTSGPLGHGSPRCKREATVPDPEKRHTPFSSRDRPRASQLQGAHDLRVTAVRRRRGLCCKGRGNVETLLQMKDALGLKKEGRS